MHQCDLSHQCQSEADTSVGVTRYGPFEERFEDFLFVTWCHTLTVILHRKPHAARVGPDNDFHG